MDWADKCTWAQHAGRQVACYISDMPYMRGLVIKCWSRFSILQERAETAASSRVSAEQLASLAPTYQAMAKNIVDFPFSISTGMHSRKFFSTPYSPTLTPTGELLSVAGCNIAQVHGLRIAQDCSRWTISRLIMHKTLRAITCLPYRRGLQLSRHNRGPPKQGASRAAYGQLYGGSARVVSNWHGCLQAFPAGQPPTQSAIAFEWLTTWGHPIRLG